ncbi:hypothetical protein BBO99_00000465 [Phytophthora kernoviae]|uniref:RING-type domain-containing protein n=2 Tax=Phytophthora kernoviae TaxID=325452 RepID=A0A3R7H862_9STRA|nr:hypothetical protein G195_003161 [Phytophthora kernoviae 00238/432]KAG2524773.1 hypothetical protein JM18_005239 [Phytophthora kernoviae]KAG2529017.1 hypothetical protein JM16_002349 [Phytophthora kernoviae]RLN32202.1 hypothetical protein BBI17_001673 [Phytophthora kernoviae]RLN85573.1 hypothetical protein BBO99_00000465 [Phytophthora kernoviae]
MMDITVRVEVQYVAPEHALIRDVLQMFRTPAWVRFMVRYISPHLKNAAPADKTVMDSLEEWKVVELCNKKRPISNPIGNKQSISGHKRPMSEINDSKNDDECSCVICLSELQEDDKEPPVALPCGHKFHLPCIRSWLKLRSTCPSCRFQFRKAFSGSYAVRTLNSALLLKEEHRPLPKEEILNTCVGRETVRAVVNVTLSQIEAHAKQSHFTEQAAATDSALAKSNEPDAEEGNEPRAKRLRVA